MAHKPVWKDWQQIFKGLLLLVFSLGILSQWVIASQMRLSGDDYCYNAVLVREGLWRMQKVSYFDVSMYNGNRYSLNLFSGIFGLMPALGAPLLVIVSVLLWLCGLTGVIQKCASFFKWQLKFMDSLIVAEAITCLIFWSAPVLDQSLFWRSGMLPYFMPLVGGISIIWLILSFWQRNQFHWYQYVLVFFLAVIVGGFSETGAAFLAGVWGLGGIAAIISIAGGKKAGWYWLGMAGTLLAATLAAVALLYFSPSTALRRASMPEPLSIGALIALMGWNIKVYFWQAVMRRTFFSILPILFGLALGLYFVKRGEGGTMGETAWDKWKTIIIWPVGLIAVTLFWVGLILLPASYIFADYPPPRALILAQVVLVFSGMGGGLWLAVLLRHLLSFVFKPARARTRALSALSFVLVLFVLLAPLSLIRSAVGEYPKAHKWARLWDERHQVLVEAGRQNADEVHVIELDRLITDVSELSPDPDYWYNNCAEMYYGVDRIFADQPGW